MRPVLTVHLLLELHNELISLLESLRAENWLVPTVCKGWAVRDIVAHILDTQLRILAIGRDAHMLLPDPTQPLIQFLNELNHSWVLAARRFSLGVIVDLLRDTAPRHAAHYASLAPFEPAMFPVAWAGEIQSQNWFHIGRDYTEYWHHQQQIRDAVGAMPITSKRYLGPVLELLIRAIPNAYRDLDVASLEVEISGEAGGVWHYSSASGLKEGTANTPGTRISIDSDSAWRLFTNGLKNPHLVASGDPVLIAHFANVRAVMV